MNEAARAGATPDAAPQGTPAAPPLEALRARGAERFDPVGLRFLEALAQRAAARRDDVRRLLDQRLEAAIAGYAERFDSARREAEDAVAHAADRFPEAVDALRQDCEAGDFGALRRRLTALGARARRSPLAELLAHAGRHAPAGAPAPAADGPRVELKSLQHFRRTWSKLGIDRQFSHALAHAPENAGPLNSHHLVLRSLTQMRKLSPAYLEQFMSYVDALLWLDQADAGRSSAAAKGTAVKGTTRGERDKKRKPARGKAG
ncbi:DUF2894 domain-containing protein [Thauera sinica]|uniref:DUF2894 domain-containing protein n=1 Tax=Thauera sinica TaxID=2665146 RepID=A0ABW1AY74_9RHOO|nr:DUF2894 domain-containing protein [Thauera sp. K11]ATE61217.1 hypothetical protein CCZ27_15835 [Thauera sp. K11]